MKNKGTKVKTLNLFILLIAISSLHLISFLLVIT